MQHAIPLVISTLLLMVVTGGLIVTDVPSAARTGVSSRIAATTVLEKSSRTALPDGITNSQNPADKTISPQESLKRITVPDGFKVTLFAGEPDVAQPIASTFDDRGRLWVAECFSHPRWRPTGKDRILIFEDTDQDGTFDTRKVFYDQCNYLTGLVWGHGGIWICNTPRLMFIPDKNRDDIPDGPPVPLLDGWVHNNPNNVLNNLNWGPDGWLWGSVGNSAISKVGKPGTPEEERQQISRGIWRYHPVDHKFEVVALGAVNPWGLDWDDYGQGFFSNCVLGHLWHLIPGAYYQRRNNERDYPYAYSRITWIADHLHWGGGHWTDSRGGHGDHSVAGGGHAHTGAMIYLADNWPEKYRGSYFVSNLHGNRINNDILRRKGSGYVASHGKDFLFGNHLWFRCLWQRYGPDGGVFIGDWHDFGECHDNDGSHRSSGRIYKVTYGTPKSIAAFDLNDLSSVELAELQLHENEWYVRHSRRLLHERSIAGEPMDQAHTKLRTIFRENSSVPRKLRALWSLMLTRGINEPEMQPLLDHESEHIRAWAVRLLVDRTSPNKETLAKFVAMSRDDDSQLVRLFLACALQRLPVEHRWPIVEGLIGHADDAEDQNLPHMIWYGMEPLVPLDRTRALKLIPKCKIPLVRKHIARRTVAVK